MSIFPKLIATVWILLSVTLLTAQVKKAPVKKPTTTAKKLVAPVKKPNAAPVIKPAATQVKITTDLGEIIVQLSDKTPLHRDNFIKLVNTHFYDSLLFHRVIAGFMIQAGDPESRNALPGVMLGRGDVGYTIPAEFDSTLYHKKGALAAARNDNPEKASSGCQFYIVQGKKFAPEELEMIEMQNGVHFSPAKKMTYKMLGGTPNLDMNYTVFGEVIKGMEVVDQIAQAEKDNFNRPLKDIHLKMEVIKPSKL